YLVPRSKDRSPARTLRSASVKAGLVAVVTLPLNINQPTIRKMAAPQCTRMSTETDFGATAAGARAGMVACRQWYAYAQGTLLRSQPAASRSQPASTKEDDDLEPRIESRRHRPQQPRPRRRPRRRRDHDLPRTRPGQFAASQAAQGARRETRRPGRSDAAQRRGIRGHLLRDLARRRRRRSDESAPEGPRSRLLPRRFGREADVRLAWFRGRGAGRGAASRCRSDRRRPGYLRHPGSICRARLATARLGRAGLGRP